MAITPLAPEFNVRTYGAKGDGTTNDTAAVVAALAAVPAAGGTVYFPPGTYKLTPDVIVSNGLTNVEGAGMELTTLVPASSGTTFWAVTGSLLTSRSPILRNLRIELAAYPLLNGLDLRTLYGGEISRVYIHCGLNGIRCLTNAARVQFRDLFIEDQTNAGIYVDGDTSAELRYDNLTIFRSTAGTMIYGIQIARTTTADVGAHYMKGVQILGYVPSGALVTNAVAVTTSSSADTGTPILITQGIFEQINGPCLLLQKASVVFITNSWFATTAANAPTVQLDGSDNVNITNCSISNSGSGPIFSFVDGTPRVANTFTTVIGNRFGPNTGVIFNVASANTPAVLVYRANSGITNSNLTNDLPTLQAATFQATTKNCAANVGTAYITTGTGSPAGVVTGSPGDLYFNLSGGAGTTLYVKESGTATTAGWVAK